jgi:predicted nucleotidyltransferase
MDTARAGRRRPGRRQVPGDAARSRSQGRSPQRNVRVFGAIARGDDRPDSDVDLLVHVEPGRSLLDVIALEQDLEAPPHRAFLEDRIRQDATLRKLEVIGQAVKNLSEDTRSRRPEIPWRQIAGMRDKVAAVQRWVH